MGVIRLNKGNNLCDWVEGKISSWLEPISMWNNLPKEIAEASGLESLEGSWGAEHGENDTGVWKTPVPAIPAVP